MAVILGQRGELIKHLQRIHKNIIPNMKKKSRISQVQYDDQIFLSIYR